MQGGILFPLKSIGEPFLQGASALLLLVPPGPPWQWDRGDRDQEKGHRAGHLAMGMGTCTLLGSGSDAALVFAFCSDALGFSFYIFQDFCSSMCNSETSH